MINIFWRKVLTNNIVSSYTGIIDYLGMYGVDWRKKVKQNVEYFHEVHDRDFISLGEYIQRIGIHILLDWDGYSNNGLRPMGLFAMQSTPLAVNHQEYLGTIGGEFTQYIVTDTFASPLYAEEFHTEKFIWLPHCFFINSFPNLYPLLPRPIRTLPTEQSPEIHGCGGPPATFIYCNLNKHLKFNPHVFSSWLRTIKAVHGSVLCLNENPKEAKENIYAFVKNFDESLLTKVRYVPQTANPYDNQIRQVLMCNVALDTSHYGSHTTAVDALWGAIPLITYGNGTEMSSRTAASMLRTVGIEELIAYNQKEYDSLSINIGINRTFFESVRGRLVDAAEARNPRNPFWDLKRYRSHSHRKGIFM